MVFHPTPMMLAEPNKYVINNLITRKKEREKGISIFWCRGDATSTTFHQKRSALAHPHILNKPIFLCVNL